MADKSRSLVRVGVIGAGASGLAQVKQLLDVFARDDVSRDKELEVVVFEKNDEVGGVWLADESQPKPFVRRTLGSTSQAGGSQMYVYPPKGSDPSPMYDGLRTNLPYDLMAYRDLPMPSSLPTFPTRAQIQAYLESYATTFNLRKHIRLKTCVTRLYTPCAEGRRRWIIEWANDGGVGEDEVDYVCCANGHYADGWIPEVRGLEWVCSHSTPHPTTFTGEVTHSRYFRSADDYAGKTVLVVGSFASGGDISRLLAAHNLRLADAGLPTPPASAPPSPPRDPESEAIRVHVSCSQQSQYSVNPDDPSQPWGRFVTYHPLISRISSPSTPGSPSSSHPGLQADQDIPKSSVVHFEDGSELAGVDVIIYATGYNFALPFAKRSDAPWRDSPLLDGLVREGERRGGWGWEEGGMKGLGVTGLDELMLFMAGDRSICFPVLQYQIVPFPMAETQTRLSSLLWAGLLPSFPVHPHLPSNPSNPFSTPPPTPSSTPGTPGQPTSGFDDTRTAIAFNESRVHTPEPLANARDSQPPGPEANARRGAKRENVRKVVQVRQKLVFGAPYEWVYQEYLFGLMREAEVEGTPGFWREIEGFRKERRADTTLRKRELGY